MESRTFDYLRLGSRTKLSGPNRNSFEDYHVSPFDFLTQQVTADFKITSPALNVTVTANNAVGFQLVPNTITRSCTD